MYYFVKTRKKGTLDWKVLREDGRILVFNRYENVKKYADGLKDFVFNIIFLSYNPSHRRSPIYRKKYKKVEW